MQIKMHPVVFNIFESFINVYWSLGPETVNRNPKIQLIHTAILFLYIDMVTFDSVRFKHVGFTQVTST